MAKQFDPRKVLKDVSNGLLRELFTQRGVLQDVSWDEMDETHIEPMFEGWQKMPERDRLEVQVILQDVNELADERGLNVLVEVVQGWAPERVAELAALEGRHDRAMWVYLDLPDAFEEAAMFARADALAAGRYWVKRNNLPKKNIVADEKLRTALADALTEHYWPTQMRGQYCSVEHYRRANGTEYFFAYLDDYPDSHIVFDDAGHMQKRSDRYAFTNVFAYCPTDGALELFAKGGKKVIAPLQTLFCKAVLDEDVEPDDLVESAYQLDHLKDRSVPLPTDPADCVAEVQVRGLRLEIIGSPRRRITLDAAPQGHRGDIYQMIERYLDGDNLPLSKLRVVHARFCLMFMHEGSGRAGKLTFNVGRNSCDLKSKTDEMRAIGERCLKLWRIVND